MLPNDRVWTVPADIGKKVKPIPVIDRFVEVDVIPKIKNDNTVHWF